jgi:hypothetical protein
VLLVVTLSACAGDTCDDLAHASRPVLGARTGSALSHLLDDAHAGRLGPAISDVDVGIQSDRVRVALHRKDGSSASTVLVHPRGRSLKTPRFFALTATVGLTPTETAALTEALDRAVTADPWDRASLWIDSPPADIADRLVAAITVALLLGPAILGLLLGMLLRRVRAPRWLGPFTLGIAPLLALAAAWVPLGFWDLLLMGLGVGVGCWVGLSAARPVRSLAGMAVLLAVSAGLLELLCVWRLRQHPPIELVYPPGLLVVPPRTALQDNSSPLRLDANLAIAAALAIRDGVKDDPRPFVAHLGDSMIQGPGVAPDQTSVALLERQFPAVGEVSLGLRHTGPDIQFLLLSEWLARTARPPRVLVHHLFSGNDIEDLDCDFNLCSGGGVLDYPADGPVACRNPGWVYSPRDLIHQSPAPYPLRALSTRSLAATYAIGGLARVAQITGRCASGSELHRADDPTMATAWVHLEQILRGERDLLQRRGIRLIVSVVPLRAALESPRPTESPGWTVQQRMIATAQRLGLQVLDPWPVFEAAVRTNGSDRYFLTNDLHFNVEGHRLYADFLGDQLRAILRSASTAQATPAHDAEP